MRLNKKEYSGKDIVQRHWDKTRKRKGQHMAEDKEKGKREEERR